MGNDLSRPRMAVEKEKLVAQFPGFRFYASNGRVSSIQGVLSTSYGNAYNVKIEISPGYPYELPTVWLPNVTVDSECPHRFSGGSLCVMRSDQWSTTFSLAFMVAKTALWLNKYDSWQRGGKRQWPGKDQHRT